MDRALRRQAGLFVSARLISRWAGSGWAINRFPHPGFKPAFRYLN